MGSEDGKGDQGAATGRPRDEVMVVRWGMNWLGREFLGAGALAGVVTGFMVWVVWLMLGDMQIWWLPEGLGLWVGLGVAGATILTLDVRRRLQGGADPTCLFRVDLGGTFYPCSGLETGPGLGIPVWVLGALLVGLAAGLATLRL